MPEITKTMFVLDQARPVHDHIRFTREPDEEGDVPHFVYLAHGIWQELGEPAVITVTVEPGDRLNDEPEQRGESGPSIEQVISGPSVDVSEQVFGQAPEESVPEHGAHHGSEGLS